MNARSLTQQVPLFVLLSIAALGLSLTAAEARSPLAGVGSAMFAAALADFLLGVGPASACPDASLPSLRSRPPGLSSPAPRFGSPIPAPRA